MAYCWRQQNEMLAIVAVKKNNNCGCLMLECTPEGLHHRASSELMPVGTWVYLYLLECTPLSPPGYPLECTPEGHHYRASPELMSLFPPALLLGMADTEMKVHSSWNPELLHILSFRVGVGQDVTLDALPLAKIADFLFCDFAIHSASFYCKSSFSIMCDVF